MKQDSRRNVISVVTAPLGFFALALLIVEGILAIILVFSQQPLSPLFTFIGLCLAAFLFLVVVVGVWFLVWFKAEKLTMDGKDHTELARTTTLVTFKSDPKATTNLISDNAEINEHGINEYLDYL